ncbi:MAG: DegV family protein [Lachnospiraceae bacterium]
MSIAIMTDTNSGITVEEGKQIGIYVLSMPIFIDNTCYLEGKNLKPEQMYEAMKSGYQTSTSQPSPGVIVELWNSILNSGYDEIIYIPMTSGLSGSCQSATILSEEYKGKVYVVDNHRISVTLRESVLEAKRMTDKGYSAAEIKEYLEKSAFLSSIYLTVESLTYLQKGGRLSSTSAVLGSVLNIKPILTIQGEKIDAFSKCRGIKICEKKMIEAIKNDIANRFSDTPTERIRIAIAGSLQNQEDIDSWLNTVQSAFPDMNVYYNPLPCSIVSHVGPGAMGIGVSVIEY